MAFCEKFFEGIKHINFVDQSAKVLHQVLLKSTYNTLAEEYKRVKAKIEDLPASISNAAVEHRFKIYKAKQEQAQQAILVQMHEIEAKASQDQINLEEDLPFNDELIAQFATNFRNIHHLADILSDAPTVIKTNQTQLFIQILFKLDKTAQEQQLVSLTPDNIEDMLFQAITTYDEHPGDEQLRAKCQRIVYLGLFELIRRDCQKITPTEDTNYAQYLAFIRELKRKMPAVKGSSILDTFCDYRDSNQQSVGGLLLAVEQQLHISDDKDWSNVHKIHAFQQRYELFHRLRFGQDDRREYVKKRQDKTERDLFWARNIRDRELFTKSGQSNALFADLAEKRYFRKPNHPFQLGAKLDQKIFEEQKLEMAMQQVIEEREREQDFPLGDLANPITGVHKKIAVAKIKQKLLYQSLHPVVNTDEFGKIISVQFVYLNEDRAEAALTAITHAKGFNNMASTLAKRIIREGVLQPEDFTSITIPGNTLDEIKARLLELNVPENQFTRYSLALNNVTESLKSAENTDIVNLKYSLHDELLLRKLLELYDLHINHNFPSSVSGNLKTAFSEIYQGHYLNVIRIRGIAETVKTEYDEKLAELRPRDIPSEIRTIVEPIIEKARILRLSRIERHDKLDDIKVAFSLNPLPYKDRVNLIYRIYLDEFQSMSDTLNLNARDMGHLEQDILLMAQDITKLIERTNNGQPVLLEEERQLYFDVIHTIADKIKPWDMADVQFKVVHSSKLSLVTIHHKDGRSQRITLDLVDVTLPYSLIKPPESNEFIFSFGGTRGIVAPLEGLNNAYAGKGKEKRRFFTYCRLLGVGQYGTVKEMESLLTGLNQVLKKGNVPTTDNQSVFEDKARLNLRTRPITSREDPLYRVEINVLQALSKAEQAANPSAANGTSAWLDSDKAREKAGKLFSKDGAPIQYHILTDRAKGETYADTSENRVKEYTKVDKVYHNPCENMDIQALLSSLKDRLALSNALCTEVSRFHQLGFIHNDIKPENFLYQHNADGSYNVKFIDWATGGYIANCSDNGESLQAIFEERFGKGLNPTLKNGMLSDESCGCFVFKDNHKIHYGVNPTLQILHGARNCTVPYISPRVLEVDRIMPGGDTVLAANEKLMDDWALTAMTFGICNRNAYFALVKGRTVTDYVIPGIFETDGKNPLGLEVVNMLDFNQLFACTPADMMYSPNDIDTYPRAVMYIPTTEREGEPLHLFRRLQMLKQACANSRPITAETIQLTQAIDSILFTVHTAISTRKGLPVAELQRVVDLSLDCIHTYEKIFDPIAFELNKKSDLLKEVLGKYSSEFARMIPADRLLNLVDVDLHTSELDILCTYPNTKDLENKSIAILNKAFTPAEFNDKFLLENAPCGHLLMACITSGQQAILTNLLAKVPRNSQLFINLVRKQGLLHYALQEGMHDIATHIINALGDPDTVFDSLMLEYNHSPIKWCTNALQITIRDNDEAQLTTLLDLLPAGHRYDEKIYEALHLCAVFSNPRLFQLIIDKYDARNPDAKITAEKILSMKFAPDYSSPYHLFLHDEKTNRLLNPEGESKPAISLKALKEGGLVKRFLLDEDPSPCLIAAEKSNVAGIKLLLNLAKESNFSSDEWYALLTKTDKNGKNILNHLLEHRLFDYLDTFFSEIANNSGQNADAIIVELLSNTHPTNPLENFLISPVDHASHYEVANKILNKLSPPGLHATEAQQMARVVALLVNIKWLMEQANDPSHLEALQALLCNNALTIPFKVMLFSELRSKADIDSPAYQFYNKLLHQVSPQPAFTASMKVQLRVILKTVAAQKDDVKELFRLHAEEMDELENELNTTKAQLQGVSEQNEHLKGEARQLLIEHEQQITTLEHQIDELTIRSEEEIRTLRVSLTQELDNAQQQNQALHEALRLNTSHTEDARHQLIEQLNQRESIVLSQHTQINGLEAELIDIRSKNDQLMTGISHISSLYEVEKQALEKRLSDQTDRIQSIITAVETLSTTLQQQQVENRTLRASIDSLKIINNELEQQIDNLKTKVRELSNDQAAAAQSVNILTQQLGEATEREQAKDLQLTKQQRELKHFRLIELTQFDRHLKLIVDKANWMETEAKDNPHYVAAIPVAITLRDSLVQARTLYLDEGHRQVFKKACRDAITAAEGVLKNHRGWKQWWADIAYVITSVLTLGVGYALGKRYGWFHTETDSSHKLAIFKGTVEHLEEQDGDAFEVNDNTGETVQI